jgi:hypothetical protein
MLASDPLMGALDQLDRTFDARAMSIAQVLCLLHGSWGKTESY